MSTESPGPADDGLPSLARLRARVCATRITSFLPGAAPALPVTSRHREDCLRHQHPWVLWLGCSFV